MVNSPNFYQIKWKSIITGRTGNGLKMFAYNEAKQLVKILNKNYKHTIDHWLE